MRHSPPCFHNKENYTPTHWECEKLLPSGLSWIRLRG
jgi:hypothetical protein